MTSDGFSEHQRALNSRSRREQSALASSTLLPAEQGDRWASIAPMKLPTSEIIDPRTQHKADALV